MEEPDTDKTAGQATREALIEAGLYLFGEYGFDATSIRAIAARASTNSASIAYHFGNKEGLRRACAMAIGSRFRESLGPVLQSAGGEPGPDTAANTLEAMARTFARLMLSRRETENFTPFMLRELAHPSEATRLVYEAALEPMHKRLCQLWSIATGEEAESEQSRLTVFALIGQVLYFRIGREFITRRMDWQHIAGDEAERIGDVIAANIRAAILAKRTQRSAMS